MTIQKILGENGPMDAICNGSGCPAAILTDGEDAYVQGYLLEKEASDSLVAPQGEGFVRIPINTLRKIASQVLES